MRQIVPVAEIGQREPDDRVDGPGVEAPVEEGQAHRLTLRRDRQRLGFRWGGEMGDRLADGKIHEADAHPGRKQHGNPGDIAEIGGRIVGTELQVAEAARCEEEDAADENGDGKQVEPAEGGENPPLQPGEHRLGPIRHKRAGRNEDRDDRDRAVKDGGIDDEPEHRARGWLQQHVPPTGPPELCFIVVRRPGYAGHCWTLSRSETSR